MCAWSAAVQVFILMIACISNTAGNLACAVGQNLDCDGVKITTCNINIANIALAFLYSVLSYQPISPEALFMPRGCHEDRRVSGILAGSCLIKAPGS
jgi:hypothetical protein